LISSRKRPVYKWNTTDYHERIYEIKVDTVKVRKTDRQMMFREMSFILLKTTSFVHLQFNVQQLHALPTMYLCVLYLSKKNSDFYPI